jgi:hypothetical protein
MSALICGKCRIHTLDFFISDKTNIDARYILPELLWCPSPPGNESASEEKSWGQIAMKNKMDVTLSLGTAVVPKPRHNYPSNPTNVIVWLISLGVRYCC